VIHTNSNPKNIRYLTELFVKMGFGLDGFKPTSLDFRTNQMVADEASEIVKLVDYYNEFKGEQVAKVIKKIGALWPSTHQQVSFEFGREHSPVLYVHFPYWKSQTERFENREELVQRSVDLLKICNPDEIGEDYSGFYTRAWWD